MKKIINVKKALCLFLSTLVTTLCIFSTFSVSAESLDDPLSSYKKRLTVLNERYGTCLTIPDKTANGEEYDVIIDFYSSMTMDEFDKYVADMVDGTLYTSDDESIKVDQTEDIVPYTYDQRQKYYYKANINTNNLYVITKAAYADGYDRYTSFDHVGTSIEQYPAYVVNYHMYSFYNGNRNMSVTFNVTNYTSATMADLSNINITVNFTANGGHIYYYPPLPSI